MAAPRLSFLPQQCRESNLSLKFSASESIDEEWIPVLYCKAHFPAELFVPAMIDLIKHPEYNSSLILRAEIEFDLLSQDLGQAAQLSNNFTSVDLEGFRISRVIRRRLLARRPQRDPALLQDCSFYDDAIHSEQTDSETSICLLTPILDDAEALPYYHPRVKHLAFRYLKDSVSPTIRIEVVPLDRKESVFPVDQDSRLYRTCLSLLDTLHRYGLGKLNNYKKRVLHDQVIPRETYQDLYIIMRERHKDLVKTWQEVTDPLKHVYEDIGIATYLILLWKEIYKDNNGVTNSVGEEPWKTWPRPPGGFVDLGCGNGLLVHILVSEGYSGFGFDIRSRTSWNQYPKITQDSLMVSVFDPVWLEPPDSEGVYSLIRPESFLIANHADELSPWTPIISTLFTASGYLSIPCCAWMFDHKFSRELAKSNCDKLPESQAFKLNLGEEGSNSSYARYRRWLAAVSWQAGWEIECDTLRIPSTRNWAIIGRNRRMIFAEDEDPILFCKRVLNRVKVNGLWKSRSPEGKKVH